MITFTPAVPDLLRRFASTPYSASAVIGDIGMELQTNDRDIVSRMKRLYPQCESGACNSLLLVKIIRDGEAPCDGEEAMVLSAGPVAVFRVGAGTMIAIDSERREILGFVSLSISVEQFVTVHLPLLVDLFKARISLPNHPRTGDGS